MKIADDAESIRRRMEEIQAERMQHLMGKPIEETEAEAAHAYLGEAATGWPFTAFDDLPGPSAFQMSDVLDDGERVGISRGGRDYAVRWSVANRYVGETISFVTEKGEDIGTIEWDGKGWKQSHSRW